MANHELFFLSDATIAASLEAATAWLKWMLRRGPVPVLVIEEMARQHGLSWAMVEDAKAALDIELVKVPPRNDWSWQISERFKVPDDDP